MFVTGMTNTLSDRLREQAARCRRLANATTNREVAERLTRLAEELEQCAAYEEDGDPPI